MVLTNFESWAHGGEAPVEVQNKFGNRTNIDLFNPSQCAINTNNQLVQQKNISQISSNGYYGFSQICHNDAVQNRNKNDVNAGCETTTTTRIVESNVFGGKGVSPDNDQKMDVAENFVACGENDLTHHMTANNNNNSDGMDRRKRIFHEEKVTNLKRLRLDNNQQYSDEITISIITNNNNSIENDYLYTPPIKMNKKVENFACESKRKIDCNVKDRMSKNNYLACTNFKNEFNIINDVDDDKSIFKTDSDCSADNLLENLFLLTHGGGDYDMWRHLNDHTYEDL